MNRTALSNQAQSNPFLRQLAKIFVAQRCLVRHSHCPTLLDVLLSRVPGNQVCRHAYVSDVCTPRVFMPRWSLLRSAGMAPPNRPGQLVFSQRRRQVPYSKLQEINYIMRSADTPSVHMLFDKADSASRMPRKYSRNTRDEASDHLLD